ncbi:MAG TPA: hypothetical protein VG317_02650 [Pseudonocardiaceae bacterium]|nr:hypothetical protein [Pseudonocardiaceae bacterium]
MFGVWTWVIWPTFMKNISADPRSFADGGPTAFFDVHLVLSVVSFLAGTAIAVLGIRGLLALRRSGSPAPDSQAPAEHEVTGAR